MTKKYVLAILLSAAAQGQVGLGLAPMRQELKMNPGTQTTGVLDLSNEGARELRVLAEFLDFSIDRNTTPQFALALPAEEQWSCRTWLSLNPMMAEIGEKSGLAARYTVKVPREAAPGTYHCAIGYTSVPPAAAQRTSSITTRVRVISAFYILVGDYHPQGRLEGLTLEHVEDANGGRWVAVVTVANQGNYYFRAQGDVELLDASGAVMEKAALSSTAILPQRSQRLLVPLSKVAPDRKLELRVLVEMAQIGTEEASAQVVTGRP